MRIGYSTNQKSVYKESSVTGLHRTVRPETAYHSAMFLERRDPKILNKRHPMSIRAREIAPAIGPTAALMRSEVYSDLKLHRISPA